MFMKVRRFESHIRIHLELHMLDFKKCKKICRKRVTNFTIPPTDIKSEENNVKILSLKKKIKILFLTFALNV